MKNRRTKKSVLSSLLHCRRGSFIATTLIFMTPIIGMAILATDLGMAYLCRTEANNAADLVALASIKKFGKVSGALDADAMEEIRHTAALVASLNTTRNNGPLNVSTSEFNTGDTIDSTDADVVFGFYDHENHRFTAQDDDSIKQDTTHDPTNSIMARVRIGSGENDPFTFHLAQWFSGAPDEIIMRARSFASFGYINVVTVIDISASMDNRTYLPPENCDMGTAANFKGFKWNTVASRWFQNAASSTPSSNCLDHTELKAIGGNVSSFPRSVVMPEPITSVFEALNNFYRDNRLFRGLYRAGFLVYETTAYWPYHASGDPVDLQYNRLGNKADIMDAIEYSMNEWQRYAEQNTSGTPDAFHADTAVPGGLAPPETTYTNTGDAIYRAVRAITTANSHTGVRSSDNIVLFTDGVANCFRTPIDNPDTAIQSAMSNNTPPFCPRDEEINDAIKQDLRTAAEARMQASGGALTVDDIRYLEDLKNTLKGSENQTYVNSGRAWALANADLAAENHITIHAIYFGTDDDCEDSPGKELVDAIASHGNHGVPACAENIEQLENFFNDLSAKQSFVLVNPEDLQS